MNDDKTKRTAVCINLICNSVIAVACGIGVYFLLLTMTAVDTALTVFTAVSLMSIGISHLLKSFEIIINTDNKRTIKIFNKMHITLNIIAFMSVFISFIVFITGEGNL